MYKLHSTMVLGLHACTWPRIPKRSFAEGSHRFGHCFLSSFVFMNSISVDLAAYGHGL